MKIEILIFVFACNVLFCGFANANDEKNLNNGVCVLRGICGRNIPCADKNEPIKLKNNAANVRSITLLTAMCPHLMNNEEPKICCDETQLESIYVIIYNLAHHGLNRCPSCVRNLEKLFCQLSCSPNQKEYVKVRKVEKNELGEYLVAELDYFISEKFAHGIFNSCKHVTHNHKKVLDSMCGINCTVQHWFNKIGQNIENEGYSSYKINFIISDQNSVHEGHSYKPTNQNVLKCSESASKEEISCGCEDCPEACHQNGSPINRNKRESGNCIMKSICGETAYGSIPCVSNESPSKITVAEALEELSEMCPHLSSDSVCCTDEQIIRLNHTFEMISIFLNDCPTCVRNFEKIFCNLFCAPDQQSFMRITQTAKSENGNDMISEIEYFVNDDWAKGVYDSCVGVHRLGFNVLDHYCKPYKAQDCDHQKFLQFIGADGEHFGHSPFEINFVFSNEPEVASNGAQYKPAKQTFYKCSDKPHTGENACHCKDCDLSCSAEELKSKSIQKELPKFAPRSKRYLYNDYDIKKVSSKRSIEDRELLDDTVFFKKATRTQFDQQSEYCLFDGTCSETESRVGKVPCVNFHEPKIIRDSKTIDALRNICPELVKNDFPLTCCDAQHIYYLEEAFKLTGKLGLSICPNCLHNFRTILCQFACSPRQNQFIRIVNTTIIDERQSLVERVEYYIDETFAQQLYDSCKDINNGNTVNMMCGKWGRKKECNAQRWLEFMGRSVNNGGYSSFQMDVKLTEGHVIVNEMLFSPMNETAFSCNEIIMDGSEACDCDHCEKSCLTSFEDVN